MTQFPRLSNREWEVVSLLLQGKSNKLIASSLGISNRTVEFHLKNVYAKFQVSTRIELILKLGHATGGFEFAKPGQSTVVGHGKSIENRDRLNSRMGWATPLRATVSIIGKELEMKSLLGSKHILVGTTTALITGLLWWFTFYLRSSDEVKKWTVPLIVVWLMIGFLVGLIGKRSGNSIRRVVSSTLLGTGISPFAIIPLSFAAVAPLGQLAGWFGLANPSTITKDVATLLSMSALTALWLVAGAVLGIVSLFVTFKKPEQMVIQPSTSDHGL